MHLPIGWRNTKGESCVLYYADCQLGRKAISHFDKNDQVKLAGRSARNSRQRNDADKEPGTGSAREPLAVRSCPLTPTDSLILAHSLIRDG